MNKLFTQNMLKIRVKNNKNCVENKFVKCYNYFKRLVLSVFQADTCHDAKKHTL